MTAMDRIEPQLPAKLTRPLFAGFISIGVFLSAFGLWAIWAPLATSIQVSGQLVSSRPSYEVQHLFGGDIAEILIQEHQAVQSGELLLRLNVKTERKQLEQVSRLIEVIERESELARAHLLHHEIQSSDEFNLMDNRFENMQQTVLLEQAAAEDSQSALREKLLVIQARIATETKRLASMRDRLGRQEVLVKRGTFRASERDALYEATLSLEGDISSNQAEVIAVSGQIRQLGISTERTRVKLRERLLGILTENEKRLPELVNKKIELEAIVDAASVRAPVSGVVSGVRFDTDQMYAPRGETLLTVTRIGAQYRIGFTIPPHQIDQVRVGGEGHVVLTGLPQRNLPKVRAVILSLAPVSKRDADGNSRGYEGVAKLNAEDVNALRKAIDPNLRLSLDMPVALTFKGREVTFASYMVAPFFVFLTKAFQD